jgi:type II secretory pathway pseudopilin PulG
MGGSSHTRQMIGSLLVALVIVALAIVVVTDRFGPTSAAERELQEERIEQREELREERREAREERREERERR